MDGQQDELVDDESCAREDVLFDCDYELKVLVRYSAQQPREITKFEVLTTMRAFKFESFILFFCSETAGTTSPTLHDAIEMAKPRRTYDSAKLCFDVAVVDLKLGSLRNDDGYDYDNATKQ